MTTKAEQKTATPEPSRQEVVTGKVADAYEAARDQVAHVAETTVSALESNPVAALLAGIALGAAAGALLPRSERERALLAPLGEKLAAAGTAALAAGRDAGADALKGSALDKDALRDQVSGLVGQALKAAGAAGTAAFQAARQSAGR